MTDQTSQTSQTRGAVEQAKAFAVLMLASPVTHFHYSDGPATLRTLLNALSEAEERAEKLRVDCETWVGVVNDLTAERDTALARIAGMGAGEPVGWIIDGVGSSFTADLALVARWRAVKWKVIALYTTPSAALARAERAEAESWHQPFLPAEFHWPTGNFSVHDPEPENHHSALYLVMPDGLMVNVSGHASEGVDVARANWMADVLNTALSRDLVRAALSPAPTVKGEGE